LPTTIKQKF